MFTSLLKIGFVSLITCFSPLSHSVDQRDISFKCSTECDSFKAPIKNAYVNNGSEPYIEFSLQDIQEGVFDSFESTMPSSLRSVNYSFEVQNSSGYWEIVDSFQCKKQTNDGDNNLVYKFYTDDSFYTLAISFEGDYILYGNEYIYDVIMYYQNDVFYNDLSSYIYSNTQINIDSTSLNNTCFYNTSNLINSYGENDFFPRISYNGTSPSFVNVDGEYYQNEYLDFADESNIRLSLDSGNYFGYFTLDGELGRFSSDLILQIGNISQYKSILQFINEDINNTGATYSNKFTLLYNFNYNAPYSSDINSVLIQDSYFTSDTATTFHKYYKYVLPYFYSNGELFNEVWVEYQNAYAIRYEANNQNSSVISFPSGAGEGYGYFAHLWYYNSDSELQRLVYVRKFSQYTDTNNNVQTYLDKGGTWINTDYRYLNFANVLTPLQRNSLMQFNNETSVSSLGNGTIDLASTFSLINNTLVSFTSFFNIVILPGITIGMLVLIPFAITLLLVIVKLFKR